MDAKFWQAELGREERAFKAWRKAGSDLVKRYRDDERTKGNKFNIFWANVETLKPVAYGRTPEPTVRRRYLDEDQVAVVAAVLTERALAWNIDDNDFHPEMERVRDDMLIPGRGVARIKYDAEFKKSRPAAVTGDDGETRYELDGETVTPDGEDDEGPYLESKTKETVYACHVHWADFRCDPARSWGEVRWVAFKHLMGKRDLKKHFGRKAAGVKLTEGDKQETGTEPSGKYACVWEIWYRPTKQRIWHAEGHDKLLDEEDDPLGLEDFFPCPEPACAVMTTDKLVPVPEFWIYQDQADELNEVCERITCLTRAAQAKGLYSGALKEIIDLVNEVTDGQLKPVDDPSLYAQSGGLKNAIWYMPIQEIVQSIVNLSQRAIQLKQEIYELSGISDLMRGATRASETAAAQQLKGQFSAARTGPRSEPMRRMVRDLYRMMAEVMCRYFSPEGWKRITGVDAPEEAIALMRSGDFEFRVDIETDATVAETAAHKKAETTEFVTALVQLLQAGGQIVAGEPRAARMVGEIVKWTVRRMGSAPDLERIIGETMDQLMQQAQQPKPDPEAMKAQAEMQQMQMEAQIEQQKAQADIESKKLDAQIKMQVAQQQMQIDQMKAKLEMLMAQKKAETDVALERERTQADIASARMKAQSDQQIAQQKAATQERVMVQQAATQQKIAKQQAAQKPKQAAQ